MLHQADHNFFIVWSFLFSQINCTSQIEILTWLSYFRAKVDESTSSKEHIDNYTDDSEGKNKKTNTAQAKLKLFIIITLTPPVSLKAWY